MRITKAIGAHHNWDDAGTARTLRGLVWRTDHGMIRILAEYDIAEMERLNEAILELNQESSIVQRSLHQTNITLTQREGRYAVESLTDALTGIGNRRRLDQAMATEVSRARRGEGTLCVIIAISTISKASTIDTVMSPAIRYWRASASCSE